MELSKTNMSEQKTLIEKMFDIQNEIGVLAKDKDNEYFKSNYFDINGLLKELKPLLEKHEILIMQHLDNINGKPAIETAVIDKNNIDSRIVAKVPLPESDNPQKMGSSITYYRRYALTSLFLLQAKDDDGNAGAASNVPEAMNCNDEAFGF